MSVITEAELRELWQNGKGSIPAFPLGTRLTPSAQDFLKSLKIEPRFFAPGQEPPPPPNPTSSTVSFRPEHRPKVIYTERDIDELAGSGTKNLVMGPEVVLTGAAREKAAALGIRLVYTGESGAALGKPAVSERLMPIRKTFYTDSEVQELARGGVTHLAVNSNVVFTAAAQETLVRLNIRIDNEESPLPMLRSGQSDLFEQVKRAVLSRVSGQVDESILDAVIRQVLERLS